MNIIRQSQFIRIFVIIVTLVVWAKAQTFEGIIVIKETTKHHFEWLDPDMKNEELRQLDREIEELEAEVKVSKKSDKEIALEELEILKMSRNSLAGDNGIYFSLRTVYIKPGMIRVEEAGQEEATIFRKDKGVVWTLLPSEKKYIESDLADFINSAGETSSNEINSYNNEVKIMTERDQPQIIPTEEMKEYNGYLCKQILSIQGKDTSEIWLTTKLTCKTILGDIAQLYLLFGGDVTSKDALAKFGQIVGFPMLSIMRDELVEKRVRVQTIEIKELQNSLFEIPARFKQATFEDMLEGKS